MELNVKPLKYCYITKRLLLLHVIDLQTQPQIDIFLNSLIDLLNVILIESPEFVFLVGDFYDRCQTWTDSHSQSELKTKLSKITILNK